VAALVEGDDVVRVAPGQGVVIPAPGVDGHPVQEHHRRPTGRAPVQQVQAETVDRDEALLGNDLSDDAAAARLACRHGGTSR
jgi:hypothetical protein